MQISGRALQLIKNYEGFRDKIYICPAGKQTIGYGHLCSDQDLKSYADGISEFNATQLLMKDIAIHETAVSGALKVPVTQGIFDSCVDLSFNMGKYAFLRSTMLKLINARRFQEAIEQLSLWVWATNPKTGKKRKLAGLISRRADFKSLAMTKVKM